MDFTIDSNSLKSIEESFDRIAKELLLDYGLQINDTKIRFTEIEFYFFIYETHEDKYTHEHQRKEGEWRGHNQGVDITFQGTEEQDGGILIRGIYAGTYINGPRNVWFRLLEHFGCITDKSSIQVLKMDKLDKTIIKTFRHGLNINMAKDFYNKKYRYLVDLEKLSLPKKEKEEINKNYEYL